MKHAIRTAIAVLLASLCLCASAGAEIVNIDIPHAISVFPAAMNDKGQVTGVYGRGSAHAFIWQLNRPVVTFDVPNGGYTQPVAISAAGVVTGWYLPAGARIAQGFVRAADGTITIFQAPDGRETDLAAANRKGWSAGANGDQRHPFQVFLRSPSGDFTEFAVPGSDYPFVGAVNRSLAVAGVCNLGGFVRTKDGTITMFGDSSMRVTGINDAVTITGYHMGADGFVRTSDGTLTTFAAQSGALRTWPQAIDNSGTIVGQFEASDQTFHGFIRTADGTITPFDVAGSTGTGIKAINSKGAIAGSYLNAAGINFGFFGMP